MNYDKKHSQDEEIIHLAEVMAAHLDGHDTGVAMSTLHALYRSAIRAAVGDWAATKLDEIVEAILEEDDRKKMN